MTRTCGPCSLCCHVLDVPELNKPAYVWCQHCRPGKGGCSIHATRPEICRKFECRWLFDKSVGEYWFPKLSRMVVHGTLESGQRMLSINVDRSYPNRWREEPYYSDIKRWAVRLKQAGIGTQVIVGKVTNIIEPEGP